MSYTQLNPNERFELYRLRTFERLSFHKIALIMRRSQSTLSREWQRNLCDGHYRPDLAQCQSEVRRKAAQTAFRSTSLSCLPDIEQGLRNFHSPEQIAGRLKREGKASVSYETIYKMIYANCLGLRQYLSHLRQGRSHRRRRHSEQSKRGQIPGRVGIESRPASADAKSHIGHWESDTVIGSNHRGALVTHVDKASKFLLAGLLKDKSSQQVNRVTLGLFASVPADYRQTMTFDNGKEFTNHAELSANLGVSCFFARPYHSWERGLNEHTNGLLRQFFPKGTNFKIIKQEELKKAVDLINHRPRKSLGFLTPFEVFCRCQSKTSDLE